MLNRRENMLAILNHQPHDHVGNYKTDVCSAGGKSETFENGPAGGGYDGFGCKWLETESALGAGVPAPNSAVLADVSNWKKVVKFPDLDDYDWVGQAAAQRANFDSKNQILEYCMWNAQFLRVTHLMGFEDGLCAIYEEPEACYELMDAITDFKIKNAEYAVEYFKPDSICAYDDVASEMATFMAPDTYREIIKPLHRKFNDAVRAMGVIPNMHVCGKCEAIVPDFVDEGIHAWEIAQPENDLIDIQKTYGDKLAIIGGYDMKGKLSYTDATEEQLRASVRETIDKYAPGGNFALMGMILYSDANKFLKTIQILSDETLKYGTNYYNK